MHTSISRPVDVCQPLQFPSGTMSTRDRLSTEFPDRCATLGDLARRITPTPLPEGDAEAERRVLDDIRCITAEQLGCRLEDVRPESRFVDDLGMA